jgi:NADH-quinone oxidoreductase subunit N
MTLAEMQFQVPDLRLASAEIFMLLMACVILIVDLFVKDRKRTVIFVATQLTLVGAAVVTFMRPVPARSATPSATCMSAT